MKRREYSRGALTPVAGHHPDVLDLWLRKAQSLLNPLTRKVAEDEWQRLGGGRFPEGLWTDLKAAKRPAERARIFVARVNGCAVESLGKTFQRRRKRQGQQTT